jgi:hypothetical protein
MTGLSCRAAIALIVLITQVSAPLSAQEAAVERTFKGRTGQEIRVGIFASIGSDCKSGPLPTVRLSAPPQHGNVTVKQGKLRATNLRQCLAAEFPAFVVSYKSKPEFSGTDVLSLEIVSSNGKTQIQKITVNVDSIPVGQKI